MPEQLEVRVIFEISDPSILTQIGKTDDETILRELRELGLINCDNQMTLFGLYAQEEAQRFVDEESKRRKELQADRAERQKEWLPMCDWHLRKREKWVALLENAPDVEMTREAVAEYCDIAYCTVTKIARELGLCRRSKIKPADIIRGYIAARDEAATKREEKKRQRKLSEREERELAEILQETGV